MKMEEYISKTFSISVNLVIEGLLYFTVILTVIFHSKVNKYYSVT